MSSSASLSSSSQAGLEQDGADDGAGRGRGPAVGWASARCVRAVPHRRSPGVPSSWTLFISFTPRPSSPNVRAAATKQDQKIGPVAGVRPAGRAVPGGRAGRRCGRGHSGASGTRGSRGTMMGKVGPSLRGRERVRRPERGVMTTAKRAATAVAPDVDEEALLAELAAALARVRRGDLKVRLPRREGLAGEVVDAFNDVARPAGASASRPAADQPDRRPGRPADRAPRRGGAGRRLGRRAAGGQLARSTTWAGRPPRSPGSSWRSPTVICPSTWRWRSTAGRCAVSSCASAAPSTRWSTSCRRSPTR